ncbi:MAG: carboxypeptidase-like regulatory domain-containing protein [Prevotella sp.]|nr:carboxypeptidase-like regulatory domain-containing protein [Prevotella sp.]
MLLGLPLWAQAQQLTGVVTDAETGEPIPMASVIYKGHNVAKVADVDGRFSISRHAGWNLTVSAVGYKERILPITDKTRQGLKIALKPDNHMLTEVKVKAKRQRYSRRDNPAVELMRRVIDAKKQTDLKTHDYYQYNQYEKLTLAMNDLTPEQLEQKPFTTKRWLLDQVEKCQYNDKLILPVSVDETVSQHIYRKDPHAEKTIVKGQHSNGINDLFETGDILTVAMKDVFTDVNLYDDQIRLLQFPFTSPIGKDAISFYRFYIEDTLKIERDSVIHLHFLPNNQQDFGFRGDLYVLKDSTLHVRCCELTLPKKSDVNFVENLRIEQEFSQLPGGEWVLTLDDMIVELQFAKFLKKALVIRNTRLTDYAFDELPKSLFKGKRPEVKEADSQMRDDDFWAQYRQVELTKSEGSMDKFLENVQNIKGFKYIIFGLKALIENFVETGHPSKVDIGPVNTIVTHNFIDGYRIRGSAQTTANLHPHLFLKGYMAHGFDSKKNYYDAEFIWSKNKKEYLPREFPKRTLTFQSTYDVMSPSDKFLPTDKDNMFVALKWSTVDKMMFYNRQQLTFEYEQDWAWKTTLWVKTEENEACGNMHYQPLAAPEIPAIRTTELHAEVRYAPGETYINTKQRRLTINLDAPTFTLGHTVGIKGFLGGDYRYNLTEARLYKRFWMKSWGKIDCYLKGGVQWNQVPYPLLAMPAANLSYLMEDETFNLVNNMEFLNDRYASLMLSWDMNGKLLNRLPLIQRLKWREFFGVNVLWGALSDKNNPFLAKNAGNSLLMQFPEGCHVMDSHRPYVEVVAGIHNIFKLIHVEYVRRLTYLDLPTSQKQGVRFTFRMTF